MTKIYTREITVENITLTHLSKKPQTQTKTHIQPVDSLSNNL